MVGSGWCSGNRSISNDSLPVHKDAMRHRTRANFRELRFDALGCIRAQEGAMVSRASFLASGVAGRDTYASRTRHEGGATLWDSETWATWATSILGNLTATC